MVLWRSVVDVGKRSRHAAMIADRLGRGKGRWRWVDRWTTNPPATKYRPEFEGWERQRMAAVWIGHATVLFRMGGKTILTDPVMAGRIGVGLGFATAGPARLVLPAAGLEELPAVDLVLISHAHFDHLDRPTLVRLSRRAHVVTAEKTGDLVRDLGFASVTELAWGQEIRFDDLLIRAWEVKHWGARTFHDRDRQACAYVIEDGRRRVVFGGDTAEGGHFRGVGRTDLAILGIGAYNPWISNHASPEQAWAMAQDLKAELVLPMHHSTFRLSYEPLQEPLERLRDAAGRDVDRLVGTEMGQLWVMD